MVRSCSCPVVTRRFANLGRQNSLSVSLDWCMMRSAETRRNAPPSSCRRDWPIDGRREKMCIPVCILRAELLSVWTGLRWTDGGWVNLTHRPLPGSETDGVAEGESSKYVAIMHPTSDGDLVYLRANTMPFPALLYLHPAPDL